MTYKPTNNNGRYARDTRGRRWDLGAIGGALPAPAFGFTLDASDDAFWDAFWALSVYRQGAGWRATLQGPVGTAHCKTCTHTFGPLTAGDDLWADGGLAAWAASVVASVRTGDTMTSPTHPESLTH